MIWYDMLWYDMIWYDITFQIIISDMADVSIDIAYVKSSRSYILFLFVCTYKCILFFTIYYNTIMFSEITEIFYLSSSIHRRFKKIFCDKNILTYW